MRWDFLEFFAGAGMARAGLGETWRCRFANDVDPGKCVSYRAHWGAAELHEGDVGALAVADLPGERAALAWASFPCQDLSLAGVRAGLEGKRSGTFFAFWRLIEALAAQRREPDLVMIENVVGTLSSNGGADFAALCDAFRRTGYVYGAMIVDAALFVPQSRPRFFLLAMRGGLSPPPHLVAEGPDASQPAAVRAAYAALPPRAREAFVWWRLPAPPQRTRQLADSLEDDAGVDWRPEADTQRLVALMSPRTLAKLDAARAEAGRSGRIVGAVYRRTRTGPDGRRAQRAEARFDGLAGCLRTPAGGSSRQIILSVEADRLRSRLLSAREAARLMGLPEDYKLPANYNDAYHLMGDGVVAPVVSHLARRLFEPALIHARRAMDAA
ncbi:DNA cytosine methyltransferase [Methylocella sp.]|uniref:DNA cytosine methyltransferase n=1 Tax=Methylocella sp. TaxID=1978226 RepID=UPI00378360F5